MNSNLSKYDMSIDCRESTYRHNTLQTIPSFTYQLSLSSYIIISNKIMSKCDQMKKHFIISIHEAFN